MAVILLAVVIGFNVGPAFGISTGIVGLASLVAAPRRRCFAAAAGLNWDFLVSYGVILSLPPIIRRSASTELSGSSGRTSARPSARPCSCCRSPGSTSSCA